jgi:hypothetical protein
MSDISRDEVRDRLGNIDQIRDIIFGTQTREYDARLSKLEANLTLLQQDTRDRIEQLRSSFTAELGSTVEAIEKKVRSLQANSQEECADLRQQIDRNSKRFATTIQSLDEAIDRQFESLRTDLTGTKTHLQSDISGLRDLVLEELERRFAQLREHKLSKDDFAETLFELGMRIKGSEFIPALREAGTKPGSDYEPIPLLSTRKHTEESAQHS